MRCRDVDLLKLSLRSSVLKLAAIGDKVGLWSHFCDSNNNAIREAEMEKNLFNCSIRWTFRG